jgi:hypothetical protein
VLANLTTDFILVLVLGVEADSSDSLDLYRTEGILHLTQRPKGMLGMDLGRGAAAKAGVSRS